MSVASKQTSPCSWAGAQVARLAAEARDVYQLGNLVVRGGPFALGCFAGWLFTEFPPHVLTGHACRGVRTPPSARAARRRAPSRRARRRAPGPARPSGPGFAGK